MSKVEQPGFRPGWCIHYQNAARHDACKAKIPYKTWDGYPLARQPCFLVDGKSKPDAVECASIRRPTPEEISTNVEWKKARIQRLFTVLQSLADWIAANRGKADVLECPACKGRLHISVAACNGHSHGQCETPGCVSWMQ